MKIKKVTVGSMGTCCYIVSDKQKQAFIVDPAFDAEHILAEAQGLSIQYVVLTHCHYDHIRDAEKVAKALGAEIVISKQDGEVLNNPVYNLCTLFRDADFVIRHPITLLSDGELLRVGSLTVRMMLTPGHTKGSACFFVEDAAFVGDTVFEYGIGRTDLPGGDDEAMRRSLEMLLPLKKTYTFYSGH